ncbi:ammonium transporter [Peribacillus frigoritolerans]|jgi:ammonium transporter, Amt family|uniref:Ammonium transporter n=2 Tax=Peribacillus TaxID=2675229 RepID=A0AAJ1QJK0_9BACI|nr:MULTISPECIES: ammonium transporter [Peribacillus]MCD1163562.1 ammonium transporter [Peribacillus castrilensis]QYF82606.1 ammonium transporter [Brevibacterium sp. PAMC21349]MDF1997551.1 ammonium transporter [Peribacillus frigoritolerans]MDM5282455.1 ammonium transporter [Peribacillus frigoritolerans]MDM5311056.1 ammonium transporter [Peribacillus frigoritolerans]
MQMADSVFMFLATMMVWLMTPGIALFYGGMVKSKNVLNTAMHSYMPLAVISILWVLIGYSLSFSPGNSLLGGLDWVGLKDVGFAPGPYSETIPHSLFMLFQMTFAVLTVSIIAGGIAERMKFSAFLIFTILWSLFVYAPVAHWVWGGGWLAELGTLDFAGGNVVHISSGVAGLVLAIMLGKRKESGDSAPHNLPLTFLGGSLIWFGWYGFNVGSALTINEVAMNVFVNTAVAAAAGIIGWLIVEYMANKKATLLGAVSGAISGLVAITPACGFVTPASSIIIGVIGGAVCFWGVFFLKNKLGYDDALDAFGLHGIGGTWGGIATGLFATTSVNESGANGLFYGDFNLLWKQLVAIIATYIFVAVVTYIVAKAINLFVPLRVSEEDESMGLDLTLHGEKAYHESI